MCRKSKFASRRGVAGAAAALAAALLFAGQAAAQDDLTTPPRISEIDADAQPDTASATELEEIIVVSDQNPWRLPDLGSSWRAQQEEQTDTGRISADLLPLWDPEAQELPTRDPVAVTDGIRRVGFIEIFRVRFGGR